MGTTFQGRTASRGRRFASEQLLGDEQLLGGKQLLGAYSFSGDDGSGGERLLRGRQVLGVSAGQQSKSEGQAVIIDGVTGASQLPGQMGIYISLSSVYPVGVKQVSKARAWRSPAWFQVDRVGPWCVAGLRSWATRVAGLASPAVSEGV